MSEAPVQASPLNECETTSDYGDVVKLVERPFLGHVNLRGGVQAAVDDVFGVRLPEAANTMTMQGTAIALWLGPDEWLLVHSSDGDVDRVRAMQQKTADRHASVVDVSSGQTLIAVSGPGARDVLARGCPLDLHPKSFRAGDCAQSHFEHVGITLWLDTSRPNPQEDPSFNIIVRRSFADYLWRLLDEAAQSVSTLRSV